MLARTVVDYGVYLLVRVVICIVQAMPARAARQLARWLAWLFCKLLRVRAEVVDDNLRHAFPQLSAQQRRALALAMWEHLFLLVLEVAQAARKIHHTNWRDYATLRNEKVLVRMLLSDRPVIVVTGHLGNFELGGYLLGILGFPTYTVARTLDNPFLDRFVNRFRAATGQYIIPKKGGYDQIVAVLASGRTMTFLADQYAGPKGCWVQFFGRPASAHKAIALLSLENDAPIAVCAARRCGNAMQIELLVDAVADPRDCPANADPVRYLTQWYTMRLEELIRHTPEQYWWLHRRWKDTRRPQLQRKQAA